MFSFTNDAGDILNVTAGVGLSEAAVRRSYFNSDFSELDDMTGTMDNTDEFIILDSGTGEKEKRQMKLVTYLIMIHDLSPNVGDIAPAGTNLNGGGSRGAVTLNLDTNNRNDSGNISGTNASYFVGTTQANADLAEKYIPDADYEPGTVLIIGGNEEVTVTDEPGSYQVIGVVSTEPAYLMNSDADGVAIALRGRIPCKVCGVVKKGDVLITSNTPGHAMVAADPQNLSPLQIIGRALSNKTEAAPGIVEIIV